MTRLLVTGANGLVGSRVAALAARGGTLAVGSSRGPRRTAGDWPYDACDLADPDQVRRLMERHRPDAVVHCASAADVDGCERDPEGAFRDNVLATAHVAAEAKRAGAHLVHVSSDYVFDGLAGPYGEEDVPHPRGVYALTKHMSEEAVRALAGSWAICRTAAVFGWPPARRSNFGAWLAGGLSRGEPVRLFTDQLCSFSLAASVAEMLVEIATRRLGGVWNVCGGEVCSRVDFGRRMCRVLGFDPGLIVPVRMEDVPLAVSRPRLCGLRSDRAARELASKPLPLDVALARFHDERAGHAGSPPMG